MDPLEELANAASSPRRYRRRKKAPQGGHGGLIAAAIVFAAIVIAGAIWYVGRPNPAPPPVAQAPIVAPSHEPPPPYDPADMAKFKAFVARFAAALGPRHKQSLEANQQSDPPYTYTCRYTVVKTTGRKAASEYPVVFVVELAGFIHGTAPASSITNTTRITATFARVDSAWKLISAVESAVKNDGSSKLFVVPEKQTRDVSEFYWVHAAITDAQSPE